MSRYRPSFFAELTQQTTRDIGCHGDGVGDDTAALNNFFNVGPDRFLFLNQEQYFTTDTILINNPNVIVKGNAFSRAWGNTSRMRKSAIMANHANDILDVNIPSSENGCELSNIQMYGYGTANNGLIIDQNVYSGSFFHDIKVQNVVNAAYVLKGSNYDIYLSRLFGVNSAVGISVQGGDTNNVTFDDCHIYGDETCLDLLSSTVNTSLGTSKVLHFKNCDFSHYNNSANVKQWIQTGKVSEVVFDSCYFESSDANTLKNYLIELGTASYTTTNVKFVNCHFSASNFNYYFKLTNVVRVELDNCYFESTPTLAYFYASTDTTDTVQQYILGTVRSTPFSGSVPVIATDSGKTALPLEHAFVMFNNNTSYGAANQAGGWRVSANKSDGYIYKGFDASNNEVFEVTSTSVQLKDGSGTYRGFLIQSTGEFYPTSNLWLLGRYNQNLLRINSNYVWVDANSNIRMNKGASPSADTSGFVFNLGLSGGTTSRPTTGLYTGMPYFDTTLGKPIWYNGTGWVDATGATV